jgi:hypothetical protein
MILTRTIREGFILLEPVGGISTHKILVEEPERRRPLGRIGLDGAVI